MSLIEPPRRNGRYVLPGLPESTQTRTTTLVKTIDDTEGLARWDLRQAVTGVARTDAIRLAVLAATSDKELDQVVVDAKRAAGGGDAATSGKSLHTLTEQVDAGTLDPTTLPPGPRQDVEAWQDAIAHAGLEIVASEQVMSVTVRSGHASELVAGCADRIVRTTQPLTLGGVSVAAGEHLVLDIKTGKLGPYSTLTWSAQLAVYAHAEYWHQAPDWTPTHPPVSARRDVALIAHLPVGSGVCLLHAVNITDGWYRAKLAVDVRRERRHAKQTVMPELVVPEPAPVDVTAPVDFTGLAWAAASRAELKRVMDLADARGVVTDDLRVAARTQWAVLT